MESLGSKDVLESYYDPGDKSIHSGSNLFVIMHELGHALGWRGHPHTYHEAWVMRQGKLENITLQDGEVNHLLQVY